MNSSRAQSTARSRSGFDHKSSTSTLPLPGSATAGFAPTIRTLIAASAGVFLIAAILTAVPTGRHLVIAFDEGIYIHGAQRVLAGQHIYRDFFAQTGPGTYWLLAIWALLFSSSVGSVHAFLAIEIGLLVTSIYIIAVRLAGKTCGVAAMSASLALTLFFEQRLYVNHRWDSACCIVIAAAFLVADPGRRSFAVVAGLLAGCAAVFTPPTFLVPLSIFSNLLLPGKPRLQALRFAGAVLIPLALTAGWLMSQGSLIPMLHSFVWASEHYARANTVPYGFSPVDPRASQAAVLELHRVIDYLPAALPVLACAVLAGSYFSKKRVDVRVKLLVVSGLALAVSCYPRIASNNLLFAAPLLICFLLVAASRFVSPSIYRTMLLSVTMLSATALFALVTDWPEGTETETALGSVVCRTQDLPAIELATSVIHPGDTLFVYPYQPIWYSLTGGVNPTHFDFLQPGMMTLDDETQALQSLQAHPPQWVIWHNLSPKTVLAIWPHSDPATLHFRRIEQFIRSGYSQVHFAADSSRSTIAVFRRIGID